MADFAAPLLERQLVAVWQDTSCSGTNTCAPNPPLVYTILPGQSASEQCNGVRQSLSNTAAVRCHIFDMAR